MAVTVVSIPLIYLAKEGWSRREAGAALASAGEL